MGKDIGCRKLLLQTLCCLVGIRAKRGDVDKSCNSRVDTGVAFGVSFMCSGVAAFLSFLISLSLIAYERFFGLRQVLRATATVAPEPSRRTVRHPAIITFAGWTALIVSAKFGTAAVFLVGIPAVLVASAVAGGARSPTKIPLRDAILYLGISIAIVVGVLAYAMYRH
jgi:hypothetical protein